jgi:2-keto-4-pentenoate hydratase/2-oxohepta-3-ene-1,7-dioic acid hydratase in catechol pathway
VKEYAHAVRERVRPAECRHRLRCRGRHRGGLLVTPDEFDDPDDLELGCLLNGEEVQKGRTADMVFPVPELIARLSAVTPLLPGDVLFTGTPAGVGVWRTPQRFLAPGDELVSYVHGIGEMRHVMAA